MLFGRGRNPWVRRSAFSVPGDHGDVGVPGVSWKGGMTVHQQMVVIGLGNDYRHDDAVGRVVARKLRAIAGDNVRVVEESGEGAALIEAWNGADFVILIDAVHSGGAAGTIHRFDAEAQPIPSRFFHYSTHAFSVAEAIELARSLDRLPARLIVYGIEGKSFDSGVGLSVEAERAADEVLYRVREELCTNSRS